MQAFQLTLGRLEAPIADPAQFLKDLTAQLQKDYKDPTLHLFAISFHCDYCGIKCPQDPNPWKCQECQGWHDRCDKCRQKQGCARASASILPASREPEIVVRPEAKLD